MPAVTVAIPTLAADETLSECVRSVVMQTVRDIEIIVVDNSGEGRARQFPEVVNAAAVIENAANVGFGAAVNQAIRQSTAEFVAVINDDAVADPRWLEAMLHAAAQRYEIGMCAPQIRFYGEERLDSAGMLLGADGSSKQRGHGRPVSEYSRKAHVLFPSGCAALYRKDMLDEIGLFDESFFLYCEDSDLGLRARWNMWECVYVPEAMVQHRYSQSSGSASAMKAWYVERNRLRVAVRNLPASAMVLAPLYEAARYFWHLYYMSRGAGKAAEFRGDGGSALRLPWFVVKARFDLLYHLPALLRQRRQIRKSARMSGRQFSRLLRAHGVSAREVASL